MPHMASAEIAVVTDANLRIQFYSDMRSDSRDSAAGSPHSPPFDLDPEKLYEAVVENARLHEMEMEHVRSLRLGCLAKKARHRIKNNLRMIMGLLSMSDGKDGDNEVAASRSNCVLAVRTRCLPTIPPQLWVS